MTFTESALVMDIGTAFQRNNNITHFTELYWFTSMETLANNAFYYDGKLTQIRLPMYLKRIGGSAFFAANDLRKITYPPSLTTVDGGAWYRSGNQPLTIYCYNKTLVNVIGNAGPKNPNPLIVYMPSDTEQSVIDGIIAMFSANVQVYVYPTL